MDEMESGRRMMWYRVEILGGHVLGFGWLQKILRGGGDIDYVFNDLKEVRKCINGWSPGLGDRLKYDGERDATFYHESRPEWGGHERELWNAYDSGRIGMPISRIRISVIRG
ncbi:MAG TPA: hypothetical protein VJH95_04900 [Candidatus Nanoarchaeia archaeon]|nr:hypothetical protein [Candidatus Nanoarchaeia archaeon]